jgi:hypothetical protein
MRRRMNARLTSITGKTTDADKGRILLDLP